MIYSTLRTTCFKICNGMVSTIQGWGGDYANIELWNWDGHASINEMPANDILGPAEIQCLSEGGLNYIEFKVGVSTTNDYNIHRLVKIIDHVYYTFTAGHNPMFDMVNENGDIQGRMKVAGPVMASPVARSDNRPIQFVGVQLGTDLSNP